MFKSNFYIKTLKSHLRNHNFHPRISFLHSPSSKKSSLSNPAIQFILDEAQECGNSKPPSSRIQTNLSAKNGETILPLKNCGDTSKVQILHPWPEWVNLMEKLLKNGYFEGIGNPFGSKDEMGPKEANVIRTACLNFARDNCHLIRYLSREDILVVAGSGCPSTDRKVVNSGKRLRAHVGVDEGNTCSSCILRGDCERAYVKAREDEGGRTVDVMRFVFAYGLDPVYCSVENKPCLNKMVKESVRKLLNEMMDLRAEECDAELPRVNTSKWDSSVKGNDVEQERSHNQVPMKQGDWICPKCQFLNFARNVKCLRCDGLFQERLRMLSEAQDHLPPKKGDWICDKCNFLNFARNTRCLQCKEKPPKRQLNPGEWECESCNYINFRRNMVCLKCDHRRPIASHAAGNSSQPVSNAVNNHQMQNWFGQLKLSRDEGVSSRKFVESDGKYHAGSNSWNQVPEYVDFPVVGGKSDLSRNVQNQEMWKMEMVGKSRIASRARENAGEFNSIQVKNEFFGSDDDDEMADWFGHGKDQVVGDDDFSR